METNSIETDATNLYHFNKLSLKLNQPSQTAINRNLILASLFAFSFIIFVLLLDFINHVDFTATETQFYAFSDTFYNLHPTLKISLISSFMFTLRVLTNKPNIPFFWAVGLSLSTLISLITCHAYLKQHFFSILVEDCSFLLFMLGIFVLCLVSFLAAMNRTFRYIPLFCLLLVMTCQLTGYLASLLILSIDRTEKQSVVKIVRLCAAINAVLFFCSYPLFCFLLLLDSYQDKPPQEEFCIEYDEHSRLI